MKMHKVLFRRAAALALTLLLCVQAAPISQAAESQAAEETVVRIGTAEELCALSECCALDAWSRGKIVVLTADISLASVDFLPIATFGGVFDGGGHTISGLSVTGRLSPAGLFGVLQESAAVKDLHVGGTVSPAGTMARTGGIAGENYGLIKGCTFTGTVTGEDSTGGIAGLNGPAGQIEACRVSGGVTGSSMTGGVVGENRGVVLSCVNESYVNITGTDPGLNLSSLELSPDLFTLRTLDAANITTDTGGVAGFSDGMILSCANTGSAGYPHVGYNVGGIAGRSSGFVSGCVNWGEVLGRKDVGGIVGQAEPYVVLDMSADTLETIRSQLHTLEQLVDRTVRDARDASRDLTSQFSAVNDSLDDSVSRARALADRLTGYGGDVAAEVNRGGAVLSDALKQLSDIAAGAEGLSDQAVRGLAELERAVRELAAAGTWTDEAVEELLSAADDLSAAGVLLKSGMEKIGQGIDALAASVQVKDEEAAQAALQQIAAGAVELAAAMEPLSEAMGKLGEAMGSGDPGAAQAALTELSGIFTGMTPAFRKISEGMTVLGENVSFDLESARSGLTMIREGMGQLAGTTDGLNRALKHLKDALRDVDGASGALQKALDSMADALDVWEDAGRKGGRVLKELRDLTDYLAGVDPIQLARPDDVLREASDGLFDALARLGDRLDRLNRSAGSAGERLTVDLQAINSQFGLLMDTLLDAADNWGEDRGGWISDTSEEDIDAVTSGRVRACRNEGNISGDLCAGGVAGSLAVEYELDPEDDALGSGMPVRRRAWELKAILDGCVNAGTVSCRRDCAGGVCGRQDLGLITDCQGYGVIESESGDYVGGVAGLAAGTIRDCFAKCVLSGGKYVGGIVGDAGIGETGGTVARSTSFVRIGRYEQFAGAVSGGEHGAFRENRFVSDTLAGIGRASVAGQAEPLTYEELLALADLPAPFRELTLRFLAGDRVVKRVSFRYGDSFGADVFPAIPEEPGSCARWDRTDLTALRFDTDVSAVYEPYRTALCSEETRSDGRPVLFVEGQFGGEAALLLQASGEEFSAPRSFTSLCQTLELWQLSIPEDGLDCRTARYLSPGGSPDHLEVYRLRDGKWQRLETESVGSYLLFEVTDSRPVLAVCSRVSLWWAWMLVVILALAALIAAVLVLQTLLKRRKNRKNAKDAENRQKAPVSKAGPGKKRRLRRVFAAGCVLLLCLAGVGAYLALSDLPDGLRATRILVSYARQESFAMELTVQAGLGEERMSADTELRHIRLEGKGVTCARQLGTTLYYCGGAVYFENGASFRLGGVGLPNYAELLETLLLLYRSGDISVFQNNSETIYGLTVTGGSAQALIGILLPEVEELGELDGMDIELSARSGALSELRFSAGGTLADGRPAGLSACLRAKADPEAWEIPGTVRSAILSGGTPDGENDAGLVRLLEAWAKLNLTDPLSAQLSLSADCGPLMLNDQIEVFRTWTGGKQAGCVRRAGRSLCFSDGTLYGENGEALSLSGEEGDPAAQARLLELAHRLSFQTEMVCRERDGLSVYTLLLTPEEQEETAHAILPASGALDIDFTRGVLEITVADREIDQVRLSCGGRLKLLAGEIPADLSCTMRFEHREFSLPEAVASAMAR